MGRGTARFALEVREEAGYPEQEVFLLTDAMEHTLCVYDRKGLLSYVEYPNQQRLVFSYGEEGLERIVTSVGNVLEVSSRDGHILQITFMATSLKAISVWEQPMLMTAAAIATVSLMPWES